MCRPSNHSSAKGREQRNSDARVSPAREPPSSLSHQVTTDIQHRPARISSGRYRLLLRRETCGKCASRVAPLPALDSIVDQPCFPPATPTPRPRPRRSTSGDSLQESSQSYSRRYSTSTSPCPRGRTLAPRAACASLRARPPGVRALCSSLAWLTQPQSLSKQTGRLSTCKSLTRVKMATRSIKCASLLWHSPQGSPLVLCRGAGLTELLLATVVHPGVVGTSKKASSFGSRSSTDGTILPASLQWETE